MVAQTLATLDGANIEIKEYAGDENIFVFGLSSQEVTELGENQTYNSRIFI